VTDPSGQHKGFGFCDFRNADGGLRALRLLNGLRLGDRTLMLKVDEKTQSYIDDYEKRRKELIAQNNSLRDNT